MGRGVPHSTQQRYEQLLNEIEEWLERFPQAEDSAFGGLLMEKKGEVKETFNRWLERLPEKEKHTFLEILDQLLIHLANFLQKGSKSLEVEEKILLEGRLFVPDLYSIGDMTRIPFYQLEYIEEKFTSRFRLYSLMQGGATGLGHPLVLALDLPALITINLQMIQYIAGTYGYSLRSPGEQLIALQVLYGASLPKQYTAQAWQWLVSKVERESEEHLLFHREQHVIQEEWLETLAKHLLKSLLLLGLRKTSKKGISLLGILLGANTNYTFTKQVAQFTSYFYRYRCLRKAQRSSTES